MIGIRRITLHTVVREVCVVLDYDLNGRLIDELDEQNRAVHHDYDKVGNRTASTDRRGASAPLGRSK